MKIYGAESIQSCLKDQGYLFKLIANENGVILFPYHQEHREMGRPDIRYADDSAGNALAAMVKPGRIEFRFHQQFSDQRVISICKELLQLAQMQFAAGFVITYQARVLNVGE